MMNETDDKTLRASRLPEVWPGWETVRVIGRGSFGAVYEIQREVFGQIEKAALKLIRIPQNSSEIDQLRWEGYEESSITETFREQLGSMVQEYTLMRKLNGNTNVVNCDDLRFVLQEDGISWALYIKMELLRPMAALGTSILNTEGTLRLGMDICRALMLCERHSIIHRDIKPSNIFVSEEGDFKLGDFGVSKTMEMTTGGTKTGTYDYMAPEVYNNRPYGAQVDIYSLGMVLYWMLNERRGPFLPTEARAATMKEKESARVRRFSGEPLPPPKNGSEALKRIVLKACAFDPGDRYKTAGEMFRALDDLSRGIGEAEVKAPSAEASVKNEAAPIAEENKLSVREEEIKRAAAENETVFSPRRSEAVEPAPVEKEGEALLREHRERMEAALAASDWTTADAEAQELLKLDSRNARAYLVRFLCTVECRELEEYSRRLLADTEAAAYEQRTDSFEELRAPLLGRLASYGSEARKALGKELPPATYPSCVRSRREQRQQAEKRLSDQYLKWAGTCDPGVKADIERLRAYTLSVMDSRLKQAETEEYGAMLEAKTAYRKALSAWEADFTEKHKQVEAPKPVTYTPEPPRAPAGPAGESHASAPADSGKKRGARLWLWVLIVGAIIVGAYMRPTTLHSTPARETPVKKTSTNAVFTYVSNDSGITITGCKGGIPKDLILPGEIDGNRVTRIGTHAFSYCHSLKSVSIPEGVTRICASAFYKCESLTSVTIPDSVTRIDDYAFDGCSSLTSVTIPDGCECGYNVFPEGCTVIGHFAVKAAQVPDANTVFTYVSNDSGITITGYEGELPAELILPGEIDGQKVTAIGSSAFSKCSGLISVTIPDSVTVIDISAFCHCINLMNIMIPDSVKSINVEAFRECYSLTSVTIPESVTSIGAYAFHSCSSLTSIAIPKSMRNIGMGAFGYCSSLTSVTIPANCKCDVYAFPDNCTVIRR